jgi:putative DNA primase/helicase
MHNTNVTKPPAKPEPESPAVFYAVHAALRATNKWQTADPNGRMRVVLECFYDESLPIEWVVEAFRSYEKLNQMDGDDKSQAVGSQQVEEAYATIIKSGRVQQPTRPIFTDATNAERLAWLHGDKIRYVPERGTWIVWNGTHWRADNDGELTRLLIDTARTMREEALQIGDSDKAKRLFEHACKSEAANKLAAAAKIARDLRPLFIHEHELDANPWLFNCQNGTVDLLTCELRKHRREDFITLITPHNVSTDGAEPVRWLKFLDEIFGGDKEMVAFIQRLCGMMMVGKQIEHVFPILYGDGANGKSTFTGVLLKVFGQYGVALGEDYFVLTKNKRHSTEVMDLRNKRLAVQSETDAGARLNESRIKQQTGGGMIRCRALYQDAKEFAASHTFILETNHRPRITGTDEGIWRRVLLIPFTQHFGPDKRDLRLNETLEAEIPAILRWLVDGCLEWQRVGLNPPEHVQAATGNYRKESDLFGQFLSEQCEEESKRHVRVADLRGAYVTWAQSRGETPLAQKRIDEEMARRGFIKDRNNKGVIYKGVRLRPG